MNNKGFTLIELMVAMMILAFLSLSTTQTIRNAISRKGVISKKIQELSIVRDALNTIKRDIYLAYNHQDIYIQIYNVAQKEREEAARNKKPTPGKKGQIGIPPAPVQPTQINPDKYKLKKEIRLTHFKGSKKSVYFTSKNNISLDSNSKEGDILEVGYLLKNCRNLVDNSLSSNCLVRSSAPFIDDKVDEGGKNSILLENITKFELLYYGEDYSKDPFSEWDSTSKGKKIHKNKFPRAIKVKISIKSIHNKEKEISMELLALIRNPNNKPIIEYKAKKKTNSPQQGQQQGKPFGQQ